MAQQSTLSRYADDSGGVRLVERARRFKLARQRPIPRTTYTTLRNGEMVGTGLCPHDVECTTCKGDDYRFDIDVSRDVPPGLTEPGIDPPEPIL